MRRHVVRSVICGVVVLLATGLGFGQGAAKPEFEVASIKPAALDAATALQAERSGTAVRRGILITGARAEYIYMTLGQLITSAYQVRSSQVTGPDWLNDKRFDLVCKMPEGSKREDVPVMLQSLLASRFSLVARFEVREESVSALVVGKSWAKLKLSDEANALSEGMVQGSTGTRGATVSNGRTTMSVTNDGSGGMRIVGSMQMGTLAAYLNDRDLGNGLPVVDMTGLAGYYQVTVDMPLMAAPGATGAGVATGQERGLAELASDPGGGSLQRSLRDLGLELAIQKASIRHLIIDHVEKMPTEN